jgi:AAA domain-containing protein/bifunctional DNA primase/polymerase-like protein
MSDVLTPQREASWQIMDRATAQRKLLLAGGYVPIPINGKAPIMPEWQKQQPTVGDIAKWPQLYPSAFNTGILTRGTPTVDIDVHDAAVVDELRASLRGMVGDSGRAMVRTGQAPKCALPFRTDEPFAKISTPIFTSPDGRKHHVEVLGDGQQVVVFGKHPETGTDYNWQGGEPGNVVREELPHINAALAAELIAKCSDCMRAHGWVAEDKKNGKAPEPLAVVADFDKLYGEREQKYALAALNGCAIELAGTTEGGRNEKLNKVAYHLGTMIARGWIDETAVIDALLNASDRNKYLREHGRSATMKTIKSGINAGCKVPHPDLPDREPSGAAAGNVVPLHDSPSIEPSDNPLANFVFMGDGKPSPQKMLIEGVMPLEGLPFIGGQSSAGKTFVAVLLAACAATGKPFFGRDVKERVGSVIIAAEGKAMLNARIAAALIEFGIDDKEVPIAWVKQVPDFNTKDGVTKLARELRAISEHFRSKFGVRLGFVFVDTVSASFDIKEEADNAEAARVCKVMRRIGEATNTIVVPIHHYGENAGVGLRGASAWRANADFVLSVMADIDPQTGDVSNRQLAIAKDRDGTQGPLTPFLLKWVELGVDDAGNPWGTMVAVAEASTAKPASHWPPSLSVFRQALTAALLDSGFEERPLADGPAMQVADIKWVKSEFAKICHVDSETEAGRQEALRKQFTRKLDLAQERKLIGVRVGADRTLIWLVKAGD